MTAAPRVAYVSTYAYASGPANDVRSRGVLQALRNLGCRVAEMEEADRLAGYWRRLPTQGALGRGVRVGGMGSAVTEWLESLDPVPDMVWLYGLDLRFTARALHWARRRRVPVVCEVVDWYEPGDVAGFAPRVVLGLTNAVAMPWARRSAAGFVVASSELAAFFDRPSAVTVRIPAVMPEPSANPPARVAGEPFVVGYVGSPGKRDGLTLSNLHAVARTWHGSPLEIHIAGAEPPEGPWQTTPQVVVRHHGRVPRERAVEIVASCDATVLQRPLERRFARAGFPSKVAESMMLGTVPLINATSDLGLELTDGQDSIMLDDDSAEALERGLQQLVEASVDRCQVVQTARRLFSVESAERKIAALLSSLETA